VVWAQLTPSPMAVPAAEMSENTALYCDRPRCDFPRNIDTNPGESVRTLANSPTIQIPIISRAAYNCEQ
jgi:hypothetical protein